MKKYPEKKEKECCFLLSKQLFFRKNHIDEKSKEKAKSQVQGIKYWSYNTRNVLCLNIFKMF